MKKYQELIKQLENDLEFLDSEMSEWNRRYFHNAKTRYADNLELIERYHAGGTILEIGSVPCHLTYCMKKLGYSLVSLDIDPDRERDFIDKHSLPVMKCDIEIDDLPFEDDKFDLIIFFEIFEHLRIDPISTLRKMNRVLSPTGHILLTTPNFYSLTRFIHFLLGKGYNPFSEFEKLHTIGHMGHVREYSQSEVREFLNNTGFNIIEFKYWFYKKKGIGIIRDMLNICLSIVPKWFYKNMTFVCSKRHIVPFLILSANMLFRSHP